ncbi:MAG: OmpA family protein [Flavobacteriales bacterium]|nr:OmpA family protein [Flavobacteriales bacterium]
MTAFRSILTTFFMLPMLLAAQQIPDSVNLVVNGSFEEVEGKLKKLGGIALAKGWKSPNAVNAELFSDQIPAGPVSAPKNNMGEQSALTGSNYAGIRWWSYMNKEPRSYLQTKLRKPLKKGQRYCVRFYVSLADLSKYGADGLGVYMSKMLVKKDDEANLTYGAQIPVLRDKIYDDLDSWQGVCGVFEATGDEQYIIIGNFSANEKTTTSKVKRPKGESRPQLNSAYFYIDDVSVHPIKLLTECTCEQIGKKESEFLYSRKTTVNKALKPEQQLDESTIYFKRFSTKIDGIMDPLLNELIEVMKANPAIKIRLVGHVDAAEADRVRMRPDLGTLGMERAEAVKTAFTEAGIDALRITVADQKADSPADPAETEIGMSKNRRVEVEIER